VTESAETPGRAILDTSVLIPDQVEPIPGDCISTITLAKLHFGVLVAESIEVSAERLRRMSLLQQTLRCATRG
jgi:hypothetical protein